MSPCFLFSSLLRWRSHHRLRDCPLRMLVSPLPSLAASPKSSPHAPPFGPCHGSLWGSPHPSSCALLSSSCFSSSSAGARSRGLSSSWSNRRPRTLTSKSVLLTFARLLALISYFPLTGPGGGAALLGMEVAHSQGPKVSSVLLSTPCTPCSPRHALRQGVGCLAAPESLPSWYLLKFSQRGSSSHPCPQAIAFSGFTSSCLDS